MTQKAENLNIPPQPSLDIADVGGSYFNVIFGNHLMAQMQIKDGKLIVSAAVNGWGDFVDMGTVKFEVV